MFCGPQGEGDRAIATKALSQAVLTVQLLSGSSLLPWRTPSHWVSEVFCLCLVLNFFPPLQDPYLLFQSIPAVLFPSQGSSSLFHSGNCQFGGFCILNWFSKSGSIQTERQGEMTRLLPHLPLVLGNLNPNLYLTHIRTLLLGFIFSVIFGRAEFTPRRSIVISQGSLCDTELSSPLSPGSSLSCPK